MKILVGFSLNGMIGPRSNGMIGPQLDFAQVLTGAPA
jgi:hypothetical protein